MDALPNADIRRGGKNPSCAGLTSSTSPEVQSHLTENSHTGVSSNFVPKEKSNGLSSVLHMGAQRKLSHF